MRTSDDGRNVSRTAGTPLATREPRVLFEPTPHTALVGAGSGKLLRARVFGSPLGPILCGRYGHLVPRVRQDQWLNDWEPTPDNRALEAAFLRDHWDYGVSIHNETAKALIAALSEGSTMSVGHPLFLRLFAEFANSLESLGAWGWTLRHRAKFKLFMDGFLTYPPRAPGEFYGLARDREGRDAAALFDLLNLHEEDLVFPAVVNVVKNWTEDDVREVLAMTMFNIKQAAVQYFAANQAILTGYNKAKHGVTMLRAPGTTNPREFQIIAPHLRIEEGEEEGIRYEIQTFRVDKTMIERLEGNIESVAGSIKVLALLTWGMLEAGLLYEDA
jgi:hypothetical protein